MSIVLPPRPMPPEHLCEPGIGFARALEVEHFARREFLSRGGYFWDPEHGHLTQVPIGIVWAGSEHVDKGSAKAGTAQLLKRTEPRKWGEAMQRALLHQLFGPALPVFLITLSGPVCALYDDRQFYALIDHELCHCAIARDRFGVPRFNEVTGEPVWTIRPHDHEGFAGTTERWGAHASGASSIVEAGMKPMRFDFVPGRDFDPRGCGVS